MFTIMVTIATLAVVLRSIPLSTLIVVTLPSLAVLWLITRITR